MNRKIYGKIKRAFILLMATSVLVSCKKMFDLEPENALETKQVYRNVYDADAAVLGIYGKFTGLAERYIVLNELRGDLLSTTANANAYYRELSTHNVSIDNPLADPRPFYEVIINCNDAMKNFTIMHDNKLLDDTQYNQRYTEVGLLRSWIYLQLGIHYGSVPYVTDAIDNVNDLKDETKFPKLTFDQLLDKLIEFTEAIPKVYLNQNTSAASPTLLIPTSGYVLKDGVFKFFIQRKSLLGDINLWKGNYDKAAAYYKEVMELGTTNSSTVDQNIEIYDTYRVSSDNSATFPPLTTTGTSNPWPSIFSNLLEEKITNRERMWTLPLNKSFAPGNPFIKLFSSTSSYLLKPSNLSIQNWNKQVRTDGGLIDRRGINASYALTNGKPEVYKYLANFKLATPFETNGILILYRAAILHLRYAEAANRLNHSALAGVIINDGFADKGTKYANDPPPFNFNGFKGTVNGIWYRSIGIRGRAVNKNVAIDSTNVVDTENKIIDEEGLETAFEGYRWPDLLRIALRRKTTEPNYLADKISAKFFAEGSADGAIVHSRLEDPANWYLPFKWK